MQSTIQKIASKKSQIAGENETISLPIDLFTPTYFNITHEFKSIPFLFAPK